MSRNASRPEDDFETHNGPGWLAASGIACLLGQHWPAAAMAPAPTNHRSSHCVDCAMPMERSVDGRWRTARQPVWPGAGALRSR